MKTRTPLLLALAACLLTSCTVISVHPLSSPETAQPDPGLVGTWREKGQQDEVIIFSIKNAHWMHMVDRVNGKVTAACDFFIMTIGDHRFMNMRDLDSYDPTQLLGDGIKPGGHPGYTILRYETISGRGVLTTWGLDPERAAKAVRSGRLAGKVEENKTTGSPSHPDLNVTLKAGSEQLAGFIREEGLDALFDDKGSELDRIADH